MHARTRVHARLPRCYKQPLTPPPRRRPAQVMRGARGSSCSASAGGGRWVARMSTGQPATAQEVDAALARLSSALAVAGAPLRFERWVARRGGHTDRPPRAGIAHAGHRAVLPAVRPLPPSPQLDRLLLPPTRLRPHRRLAPFTYAANGKRLCICEANGQLRVRTGGGFEDLLAAVARLPCA